MMDIQVGGINRTVEKERFVVRGRIQIRTPTADGVSCPCLQCDYYAALFRRGRGQLLLNKRRVRHNFLTSTCVALSYQLDEYQ